MSAASTARMARHSLWNVLGMTLPMLVGLVAIPPLIAGLGDARFGTLTLVWMLVGYFGIFDLGMGRALTKLTAECLATQREAEVPALFWTALLTTLAVGILGGCGVYFAAEPLATRWLNVDPAFQPELRRAFQVVGIGLPAVVITVGMIGVLEAYERFFLVNAFRLPFGTFTFLGPLLALPFSRELPVLVGVLIAGRLLEGLTYFLCCLRVAPILRARPRLDRAKALTLLSFGGWMTLSNLLLPVMINLADRYAIGALLSVAVVTFYTTPSELVVKMLILPRSWVSVLFPRFAGGFHTDPDATGRLCARSLRLLWLAMFPASLAVIVLAPEFLRLWLGSENGHEYARRAGPIMQWLALGMYLYAPAYVPYSFLQAIGLPRRAALIHLAELPVFLAALWFGITRFGLLGAAWAWIARAVLDLFLLLLASRPWIPARSGLSSFVLPYILGAAALAGLIFVGDPRLRLGLALAVGLGWLAASWTWVLSGGEKADLRTALRFH
jgi:O-antigen/teichoic acid export membrane protein